MDYKLQTDVTHWCQQTYKKVKTSHQVDKVLVADLAIGIAIGEGQ